MIEMLSAKEVALQACHIGTKKVNTAGYKVVLSAFFAGLFIAYGYYTYVVLASGTIDPMIGKFLGALLFPVGIILIVMTGVDLFTGNTLIAMGYRNKMYKFQLVAKNLFFVYLGNFIGAIFFAVLLYHSNIVSDYGIEFVHKLVRAKTSLTFTEALIRGILCNIIVSVTVYASYASKSVQGKFLILYLPIVLFVITGFEHSVANMFILPFGYLVDSGISLYDIFIKNLIPVTIGNIIGGSVIVAIGYNSLFVQRKDFEIK